jgi:biotin carboxyl carrier protein
MKFIISSTALLCLLSANTQQQSSVSAFVTKQPTSNTITLPSNNALTNAINNVNNGIKYTETSLSMAEAIKITMPALSSTMKEGRVVSWLKSEGDEIEAGEAIMVVESDKADMDVEAFEDGYLAKILTEEGEMAEVGAVVALVATEEGDIDAVASAGAGDAAVAESAPAAVEEAPAASSGGELFIIFVHMTCFCVWYPIVFVLLDELVPIWV